MVEHAQHLSREKRQEHTVETMIQMASEHSPDEITTTAIAKRMGLSQGALFKHFPNKDAMLKAVMVWVADRLLNRIDRAVQGKEALPALEAALMTHIEFVLNNPGVPRILFGELQRSKMTPAKQMANTLMMRYAEKMKNIVEQGQQAGQLHADVDAASAATMFIGMVQGLVMQSMLTGSLKEMPSQAKLAFKIYQRGIEVAS